MRKIKANLYSFTLKLENYIFASRNDDCVNEKLGLKIKVEHSNKKIKWLVPN